MFSDDIKQDSDTNISHSKIIIELLKHRNIMTNTLSTIWENIDACAEHDIYAPELYLMSMLSQAFSVIIYRGISAPGYVREVVDGVNAIYKSFIFQLMSTVQLEGTKGYDT